MCRFVSSLSHWLLLLPIIVSAAALPTVVEDLYLYNATSSFDRRAESFFLRILPLGGSITLGWGSNTGNGYRKPLRDQLRKDGWNVNIVGTKVGGTNVSPVSGTVMGDNSVEAAAGYIVTQIQGLLASSLQFLPNLVLINAGVNDCTYNVDIPNIGTRMNSLLDDVYNNIPGVTVLLSTLLPSLDATADECHASVNAQYRSLVTTRISQGYKIRLAEFAPANSYWCTSIGCDYYDSTHPLDVGHAKLAACWYAAFKTAYADGLITAPAGTSTNLFYDDDDTFTSAALPPPSYV